MARFPTAPPTHIFMRWRRRETTLILSAAVITTHNNKEDHADRGAKQPRKYHGAECSCFCVLFSQRSLPPLPAGCVCCNPLLFATSSGPFCWRKCTEDETMQCLSTADRRFAWSQATIVSPADVLMLLCVRATISWVHCFAPALVWEKEEGRNKNIVVKCTRPPYLHEQKAAVFSAECPLLSQFYILAF